VGGVFGTCPYLHMTRTIPGPSKRVRGKMKLSPNSFGRPAKGRPCLKTVQSFFSLSAEELDELDEFDELELLFSDSDPDLPSAGLLSP
jgi:hypothetical protein